MQLLIIIKQINQWACYFSLALIKPNQGNLEREGLIWTHNPRGKSPSQSCWGAWQWELQPGSLHLKSQSLSKSHILPVKPHLLIYPVSPTEYHQYKDALEFVDISFKPAKSFSGRQNHMSSLICGTWILQDMCMSIFQEGQAKLFEEQRGLMFRF